MKKLFLIALLTLSLFLEACGTLSNDPSSNTSYNSFSNSYNLLDYFPLDVGDKWIYKSHLHNLVFGKTILNQTYIDGKYSYIIIIYIINEENEKEYWCKNSTGIYFYDKYCGWIQIAPATMNIGNNYSYTAYCNYGTFNIKFILLGKEQIYTPAEYFDTLKLKKEIIINTNKGKILCTNYINLAKNVGCIKESLSCYYSTTDYLIFEKNYTLLAANITETIYGNETYLIK